MRSAGVHTHPHPKTVGRNLQDTQVGLDAVAVNDLCVHFHLGHRRCTYEAQLQKVGVKEKLGTCSKCTKSMHMCVHCIYLSGYIYSSACFFGQDTNCNFRALSRISALASHSMASAECDDMLSTQCMTMYARMHAHEINAMSQHASCHHLSLSTPQDVCHQGFEHP